MYAACNSRLFLNIIKDVLNIDIEDDKYIGEEYGIYVIKDVLPNKDKWNHKIYKGVCKQCGYERFGTINDFKGKMISNCTHIRLLSDEQFNIWFNKNKRRNTENASNIQKLFTICFAVWKKSSNFVAKIVKT